MVIYLNYCKNCKVNCKEGLLDLKNEPHKEFSFSENYLLDYWCREHQTIAHKRVGENPTQ